jgi:hypothetical protein
VEKYWCAGVHAKIWRCAVQSDIARKNIGVGDAHLNLVPAWCRVALHEKILACGCAHLILALRDAEW